MSLACKLLGGALTLASLLFFHSPAEAQDFGLGATVTPNSALVGSPLVYSIDVTNFGFTVSGVVVTNAISGGALFNSALVLNAASNALAFTITTGIDGIIFRIDTLQNGEIARLTLNLTPVGAGPFTNQITAAAFGRSNATTTVVATVTPPVSDLAVGITNVASGTLTNDLTTIGLFVTNLGPNVAAGVVVTNTLPPSFKLLSVTPAALSNSFAGGNLALSLGTMTSGSSTQLLLTVQPTNAGNFQLIATVSSPNVQDTNTANSAVTNTMSVIDSLPGDLTVTVLSQQFNRQTGLLDMNVRLTNSGTNAVPAARIIVTSLNNGAWLYNAAGTNSGAAYALYNAPLAAGGASVNLLLEYYVLLRTPLTNYNLQPLAVPAISLTAPTNSGVIITNHTLSSGGFLIEFAATLGKTYTIVYSDNLAFHNALTAQPSIVAPANRVQWIDSGPPKTVSHPSNTVQRYYRVFQSQ